MAITIRKIEKQRPCAGMYATFLNDMRSNPVSMAYERDPEFREEFTGPFDPPDFGEDDPIPFLRVLMTPSTGTTPEERVEWILNNGLCDDVNLWDAVNQAIREEAKWLAIYNVLGNVRLTQEEAIEHVARRAMQSIMGIPTGQQVRKERGFCEICKRPVDLHECEKCWRLYGPCCDSADDNLCADCGGR
jgi:hypothetical protein